MGQVSGRIHRRASAVWIEAHCIQQQPHATLDEIHTMMMHGYVSSQYPELRVSSGACLFVHPLPNGVVYLCHHRVKKHENTTDSCRSHHIYLFHSESLVILRFTGRGAVKNTTKQPRNRAFLLRVLHLFLQTYHKYAGTFYRVGGEGGCNKPNTLKKNEITNEANTAT